MKNNFLIIGLTLITLQSFSQTTVSDKNGTIYKTVMIGSQMWMKENLNFPTDSGSWCYKNDESYCKEFGRLYNWETAKIVCPIGWHLPTEHDWNKLEITLGLIANDTNKTNCFGVAENIGGKLKTTTSWASPNEGANNNSGFSALPSGDRAVKGQEFGNMYKYGSWWTSSEGSINNAWRRYVNCFVTGIYRNNSNKKNGYSVRCIKN